MRVTVTQEVEIPSGLILYDVAAENIVCNQCHTAEKWDYDSDRMTASRPELFRFCENFAKKHVNCITTFVAKCGSPQR